MMASRLKFANRLFFWGTSTGALGGRGWSSILWSATTDSYCLESAILARARAQDKSYTWWVLEDSELSVSSYMTIKGECKKTHVGEARGHGCLHQPQHGGGSAAPHTRGPRSWATTSTNQLKMRRFGFSSALSFTSHRVSRILSPKFACRVLGMADPRQPSSESTADFETKRPRWTESSYFNLSRLLNYLNKPIRLLH